MSVPARPKELKLDSVAPCSLLTDPQRASLSIGRSRELMNQSNNFKGAKQCAFDVSAPGVLYDYRVTAITTEGIGPWLEGKRNVDATLISVEGFAASKHVLRGAGGTKNSGECGVSVDVAEGQQLLVSMTATSKDKFTQDQICQMTEQAAGMAVTTLRTLG